ncbi:hypothetical protein AB6A40_002309 [Gnathostoma spinigerum]|uniref:RING-type domain-containing protein n=1 Tax=Gnathostoma spinigerum TaxID=75299 RepID=A0ABD6EH01_9BILA
MSIKWREIIESCSYCYFDSSTMVLCLICLFEKEQIDIQPLPCGHSFCRDCLARCTISRRCPSSMCQCIRRANVVVDEADEVLNESCLQNKTYSKHEFETKDTSDLRGTLKNLTSVG